MLQNVAQVHFDLDRVLGDIDHDVTDVLIASSMQARVSTALIDPKSLGMCQILLSLLISSFKTGRGNQNWF